MSSLLEALAGQLDEQTVKQISSQLGADEQSTQQAIGAALPMLVGALDRNASTSEGAQSLTDALMRDHDGGILDDVAGSLSSAETLQDGNAILGHVLGSKRGNVEQGVSMVSGLDENSTSQLMSMMAPLILGALGQMQRQGNLDADGIAGLLHSERQETESSLSGIAQLLDMDRDGDATDDVIKLGASLLGGLFGRKK